MKEKIKGVSARYVKPKWSLDEDTKVTSCQDILYYLKWDLQGKEIDQKQERNLLSKVFNLCWNLWNHWTRICIRLSTLCINFRLLKVYIWDRHQKYAELNTIQWIVHWLIQVLESFFLYLFNLLWQDRSLHPYHNLSHLRPSYRCWPHSSAYHYCQVKKYLVRMQL